MSKAQSSTVPGMPCPNCETSIVIDPMVLLSGTPITCAACGLELHVNMEKSAETLSALSAYLKEFESAEQHLDSKTKDFTQSDDKPTRSRAPRRRARRASR